MLKKLKQTVFQANLELVKHGLVIFTWGSVSGIDRERGFVLIKPSGVSYDDMLPDNMVVVDLELYKAFLSEYLPNENNHKLYLELYKKYQSPSKFTETL
jgi:L-ribulose-5-phosphate 4-epimerase